MKKKLIIPAVIILCLIFGAVFAIGVMANNTEKGGPMLKITGANLVFSDRVHILYAVDSEEIDDKENIELLIFRGENVIASECIKGKEVVSLSNGGKSVNDSAVSGMLYEYADIAAAEMTENIYARAYYTVNGAALYSPVVKYSVIQYACNKLGITGTATTNPELEKMLEGMLVYGAAAQEYFDVNLDRLATDEYVKYTFEDGILSDGTSYGLFKKGEKFSVTATGTTESNPHAVWTDENGRTVAAGASCEMTASKNRTLSASAQSQEPSFGSYKYVVIVGVDGAGSFYPDATNTPNIDSIFANGAVTRTMRVATPTSSSVSWMSALHGVKPENHGNMENSEVEAGIPYTMNSKYPSILRVVKEARPDDEVAAIYSWIGIDGIVESEAGITKQQMGDSAIPTYLANGYIKNNTPTLLYIHLNDPDYIGHTKGHLSDEYYAALETADKHVGAIYKAYEDAGILDETLFIVTADHGGKDTSHGGLSYNEKYVLFAASGKNVTNTSIENMYIRDTAAIALHALGIEQPDTYTSLVPNGIFADEKDNVRLEYHDPDAPRYRIPEATPTVESQGYITNFIDRTLALYMPFDGTTEELLGSNVSEFGILSYEDGYFGKGIQLEDGHLNVNTDFTPGTESFTISTWAKFATPTNGWCPIISTKTWHSTDAGFSFASGRTASSAEQSHYGMFEIANGSAITRMEKILFPEDYIYGYVHVLITVDKENGLISVSYDFGEPEILTMSSAMQNASLDSLVDYIVIGDDPTGECAYKSGVTLDELMIFEGAFDDDDKAALMSYFGLKAPEIPDEDNIGDVINPDVYFSFNDNVRNEGSLTTKVIKYGTPVYTEGKDGNAYSFNSTNYLSLNNVKFGTGSYTVATWFKASNLTIEEGNQVIPILSSSIDYGRVPLGINIEIKTGTGELWFTMGNGTKGVQQMYRFFCPSSKADDAAFNIYPSYETFLDQWIHFAVVVDRDAKTVSVYMNFEKVMTANLSWYGYGASAYIEDDFCPDNPDVPVTIGQVGTPNSAVTSKNSFALDDLMIFTRALSASDIYNIRQYYMNPLSDYVCNAPEIRVDFEGSYENLGSSDTNITEYGQEVYTDGVYGQAGIVGGNNYFTLDDYKFGTDSFTVSTWFKTTSLKNESGNQIITILSSSSDHSRTYPGINLTIRTGNGNLFLTFNDGTTMSNGWAGAMQRDYKFFCPSTTTNDGSLPDYTAYENTWIHFAITFDRAAKTVTVYMNFEKVMTAYISYYGFGDSAYIPADSTPDNPDLPITVGQLGVPNLGVTSKTQIYLDDLMIFRGGLNADEIKALKEYYQQ